MNDIVTGCSIPILFVRDVTASAAFYREGCGFEIDFLHGDPPSYGAISRGDARLHLRFVRHPNFTDLAAREASLILATIEVSDVEGLFQELTQRGACSPRANAAALGWHGFARPRPRRQRDFLCHV